MGSKLAWIQTPHHTSLEHSCVTPSIKHWRSLSCHICNLFYLLFFLDLDLNFAKFQQFYLIKVILKVLVVTFKNAGFFLK